MFRRRVVFVSSALVLATAFTATGAGAANVVVSGLETARPADAFAAGSEADVVRDLFGNLAATPSKAVRIIDPPYQAMPGTGVPLTVECDMDGVETIAVVTRNDRHPLNTVISFPAADHYYRTDINVERTSPVTVYVKAGGKLYSESTMIKVNGGGYAM
jgi:predicted secreted protein